MGIIVIIPRCLQKYYIGQNQKQTNKKGKMDTFYMPTMCQVAVLILFSS